MAAISHGVHQLALRLRSVNVFEGATKVFSSRCGSDNGVVLPVIEGDEEGVAIGSPFRLRALNSSQENRQLPEILVTTPSFQASLPAGRGCKHAREKQWFDWFHPSPQSCRVASRR